MGLALGAPHKHDLQVEAQGVTFLVDRRVITNMAQHLPFKVDYDARYWPPLRVLPSRRGCSTV
jgi:hypothetical protein